MNWLRSKLHRYVIKLVTPDELLTVKRKPGGRVEMWIKGLLLPEVDYKDIIGEARAIHDMLFWGHLLDDLRYHAIKRMAEATSYEEVLYGKALFSTAKALEDKVEYISKVNL